MDYIATLIIGAAGGMIATAAYYQICGGIRLEDIALYIFERDGRTLAVIDADGLT